MFGNPSGGALLTLSPAAVSELKSQMTAEGHSCVRIGVKRGGCAGMEYTMDFASEPDDKDEIVEQDGVRVAIAPAATLFLVGTEVDFKSGILESGFSFRNPNVSESCGCGESVKFAIGENTPVPTT